MFARYTEFIDESPVAAFLWSTAGGITHANLSAHEWTTDLVQSEALEVAALSAARDRRAKTFDALNATFLMVPLIEANDRVRYVVGLAKHDLGDVPVLLHALRELATARRRSAALAEIAATLLNTSLPIEELIGRALASAKRVLNAIWIASFKIDDRPVVIVSTSDARSFERALDGSGDAMGATAAMKQWKGEERRPVLRVALQTGKRGTRGMAMVGAPGSTAFDRSDLAFFSEVGWRISVALANIDAYRRESRIASLFKKAMLPFALPHADGLIFDVAYRAADIQARAGGDWYDAFDLPDGRIAIAICDVSGHGLDAAVALGYVRESVRVGAMRGLSASDVLAGANRAVINGEHGLVSAFIGYVDPLTLSLEYTSAGHPPPFVVQAGASVSALQLGDLILGAVPGATFRTMSEQLVEDSALVLYSDGLVEHSRDLDAGEERLKRVLSSWGDAGFKLNANEIAKQTLGSVLAADDVAMLLVRVVPSTRLDSMIPGTASSSSRTRAAIERILKNAPFEARKDDFVLATSEAINNAIEHGSRSPQDRFHFLVEWDESGARAVIESFGKWRKPTKTFERGRGLMIMRALTDHMVLNVGKGGTTVRLYLDSVPGIAKSHA